MSDSLEELIDRARNISAAISFSQDGTSIAEMERRLDEIQEEISLMRGEANAAY